MPVSVSISTRSAIGLGLLTIAGSLGNYFKLPLFFGVDFLFGSIAVLLAVKFYGPVWGTLSAAIASWSTWQLWGHPYAIVIFCAEALFVGLASRRQDRTLLLKDGAYWLVVGMPLVWLFYAQIMQLDPDRAVLILLKQPVNGIFNALIASLILTYVPVVAIAQKLRLAKPDGKFARDGAPSLQQTLLSLFVALVFFPVLTLTVWESRQAIANVETTVTTNLNAIASNLNTELRLWHKPYIQALQTLARDAAADERPNSEAIAQEVNAFGTALPGFLKIHITDPEGTIQFAYPHESDLGKSLFDLDASTASRLHQAQPNQLVHIGDLHGDILDGTPHVDLSLPIARDDRVVGTIFGWLNVETLTQLLRSSTAELPNPRLDGSQVTLLDRQSRIIATTVADLKIGRRRDRPSDTERRAMGADVYHVLPTKDLPAIQRWNQANYVLEMPVRGQLPWTLAIEAPTAPHIERLQQLYIKNLGILLAIAVLALILAATLSRQLVKPVRQLVRVTNNLPDKLLDRDPLSWPDPAVAEMNWLVANCQAMASSLERKFGELADARDELERRVEERTAELSQVNHTLASKITESKQATALARARAEQLEAAMAQLQQTQAQLIQTEKMSSLGQMVAGVAHEINNPANFIHGNLIHVQEYASDLLEVIEAYRRELKQPSPELQDRLEAIEFDYLVEDLPKLLRSMRVGSDRIRQIVLSLRNFSRLDEAEMKEVDLHEGLDNTLLILQHRFKASGDRPGIEVVREYGDLPLVECYPSQLNQVFLNLTVNAIDALEAIAPTTDDPTFSPRLCIQTEAIDRDWAVIRIIDNGPGMDESVRSRLFDPFFTTKPVGKGTGLGLSISYQIVVQKHRGDLQCHSQPQQGAQFWIKIPIRQQDAIAPTSSVKFG